MMQTIGVVAGMEEELGPLAPGSDAETWRFGRLVVRRVEIGGKTVLLCCGGIGKAASVTAATLLHTALGAEALVVVGTAAKIAPVAGSVFLIDEALQSDYGAQLADRFVHYTAGDLPIGPARVTPFRAHPMEGLGLPTARIASGDLFVESRAHAERLRHELGAVLVDMETAAVAQAANLLGLPWMAVKAASDTAGDDSAQEFAHNLTTAARAAAEAVARLIEAL